MPTSIPNILTYSRIAFVPVLVALYLFQGPGIWISAIFVLISFTDWLDGYIARRMNQTSLFGAFLDPVADKLLVVVALILLVSDNDVLVSVQSPILFIIVTTIIVGREITVSALREWMAEIGQRGVVAVNRLGKLKTLVQIAAITMLLYGPIGEPKWVSWLGEMLLYLSGFFTLLSMVTYLRVARKTFTGNSKAKQ
ncbi:MAG: CDP-diacylglycerol--glycerol-3-phosphate 3-phosphatidyltransferase [Acidiferrobacteraceae bacterium]|nr:CDP-diacylglycerol--glycerol-3-phosphate 3-phosphatidyltransferase [Acidiferrobacteraceae bacterium]